jgi:hypothetical protein
VKKPRDYQEICDIQSRWRAALFVAVKKYLRRSTYIRGIFVKNSSSSNRRSQDMVCFLAFQLRFFLLDVICDVSIADSQIVTREF